VREVLPKERAIRQRIVDRVHGPVDLLSAEPRTNQPSRGPGLPPGHPPDVRPELGSGDEVQGPAHAPRLHEGPVPPERALHVLRREATDSGAEGELGGGEHLRLHAADVVGDCCKGAPARRAVEVVPGEAERVHLPPRKGSRVLVTGAHVGAQIERGKRVCGRREVNAEIPKA